MGGTSTRCQILSASTADSVAASSRKPAWTPAVCLSLRWTVVLAVLPTLPPQRCPRQKQDVQRERGTRGSELTQCTLGHWPQCPPLGNGIILLLSRIRVRTEEGTKVAVEPGCRTEPHGLGASVSLYVQWLQWYLPSRTAGKASELVAGKNAGRSRGE